MICLRLDLRRDLALYMLGDLSSPRRERIEEHLVNCSSCRAKLALAVQGEKLALELPKAAAPAGLNWQNLKKRLENSDAPRAGNRPLNLSPVAALFAFLAAVFLFVAYVRPAAFRDFDAREFHPVPISGMQDNVEPHVATEGYISEVQRSGEDGDLLIKLVDDMRKPNHFVICEIIEPVRVDVPPVGSRIRVYGVHRYDGKATHQWYEVHPVLNIERVQ